MWSGFDRAGRLQLSLQQGVRYEAGVFVGLLAALFVGVLLSLGKPFLT